MMHCNSYKANKYTHHSYIGNMEWCMTLHFKDGKNRLIAFKATYETFIEFRINENVNLRNLSKDELKEISTKLQNYDAVNFLSLKKQLQQIEEDCPRCCPPGC